MMLITGTLTFLAGFLLGSAPFAYLLTWLVKGADIRQLGDGNPGAANVAREVGIAPGIAVLLLDSGKGYLAVALAGWLGAPQFLVLMCGLAAVAGHMWSPFLRFKGGGGAATAIGVFFALAPGEFSVSFAIIAMAAVLTRNFAFSVGVGLVLSPLILWAFGADAGLIVFSIVLPLLLAIKKWRDWPSIIRRVTTSGDWKEVIIDRRLKLRKRN